MFVAVCNDWLIEFDDRFFDSVGREGRIRGEATSSEDASTAFVLDLKSCVFSALILTGFSSAPRLVDQSFMRVRVDVLKLSAALNSRERGRRVEFLLPFVFCAPSRSAYQALKEVTDRVPITEEELIGM